MTFVCCRENHFIKISLVFRSYYHSDPVSYPLAYPYRFSNDAYLAKLVLPLRSVADNIHSISFYSEPAKKFTGMYQYI